MHSTCANEIESIPLEVSPKCLWEKYCEDNEWTIKPDPTLIARDVLQFWNGRPLWRWVRAFPMHPGDDTRIKEVLIAIKSAHQKHPFNKNLYFVAWATKAGIDTYLHPHFLTARNNDGWTIRSHFGAAVAI